MIFVTASPVSLCGCYYSAGSNYWLKYGHRGKKRSHKGYSGSCYCCWKSLPCYARYYRKRQRLCVPQVWGSFMENYIFFKYHFSTRFKTAYKIIASKQSTIIDMITQSSLKTCDCTLPQSNVLIIPLLYKKLKLRTCISAYSSAKFELHIITVISKPES